MPASSHLRSLNLPTWSLTRLSKAAVDRLFRFRNSSGVLFLDHRQKITITRLFSQNALISSGGCRFSIIGAIFHPCLTSDLYLTSMAKVRYNLVLHPKPVIRLEVLSETSPTYCFKPSKSLHRHCQKP
jgi:hypothetical protein